MMIFLKNPKLNLKWPWNKAAVGHCQKWRNLTNSELKDKAGKVKLIPRQITKHLRVLLSVKAILTVLTKQKPQCFKHYTYQIRQRTSAALTHFSKALSFSSPSRSNESDRSILTRRTSIWILHMCQINYTICSKCVQIEGLTKWRPGNLITVRRDTYHQEASSKIKEEPELWTLSNLLKLD